MRRFYTTLVEYLVLALAEDRVYYKHLLTYFLCNLECVCSGLFLH